MLLPGYPINEEDRLAALRGLGILDTPRQPEYDQIVQIACDEFAVPMAMITLIDADRQWFKSAVGLGVQETIRAISFCAHTILQEGCFIVSNTLEDDRFRDHPLVEGETKFRFYAGCPIHESTGFRIGALCIVHTEPRNFDRTDIAKLTALCAILEDQIASDYPN